MYLSCASAICGHSWSVRQLAHLSGFCAGSHHYLMEIAVGITYTNLEFRQATGCVGADACVLGLRNNCVIATLMAKTHICVHDTFLQDFGEAFLGAQVNPGVVDVNGYG
jgi:hypothetical protein